MRNKDMTAVKHTRWSNEQGKKLAAQYGFTIQDVKPLENMMSEFERKHL